MDILRVLASPDLEVRKKTLNLGELILTLNMQKLANHMFIGAACKKSYPVYRWSDHYVPE
jgi:hypothetical protein